MHPGAMVGGDAHCRGLQMHRPGAARLLVEYADGTVQGFHKVLHHLCVNKAAPCTGTLHGWSVPGTALVLDKPCNTDMLLLAHKGCPGRPRGTFAMGCSSALMALFEQGKLSLSAGQTISQCRGNYHSVQDKLSLSAGQTISQCRGNYHSVQGKLSLSAGDTITQCRGNYHSVQGKLSLSAGETITQCRANSYSVLCCPHEPQPQAALHPGHPPSASSQSPIQPLHTGAQAQGGKPMLLRGGGAGAAHLWSPGQGLSKTK